MVSLTCKSRQVEISTQIEVAVAAPPSTNEARQARPPHFHYRHWHLGIIVNGGDAGDSYRLVSRKTVRGGESGMMMEMVNSC